MSNLASKNGKQICNGTLPLLSLNPGKYIHLSNIFIKTSTGSDKAGHITAFQASCVPLDQTPYNQFLKEGIKSAVSDPKSHRITFGSNGNMSYKEIIYKSCKVIIDRLNIVKDMLDLIESIGDLHTLIINNECDTIGNIIMKTGTELYPKIGIRYDVAYLSTKKMTISIVTENDPKVILNTIIKNTTNIFENIQKQINA